MRLGDKKHNFYLNSLHLVDVAEPNTGALSVGDLRVCEANFLWGVELVIIEL